MVVEQRIGRIQRLASEYANVVVYNITLRGTFEEYIVGRLIEKLQMASNAIGDVNSLLQGSDDSDEEEGEKFEERLLQLVLKALASKDKKRAVELEVASIEEAMDTLQREKKNIEDLLGDSDDRGYVRPKAPTLPPTFRSMSLKEFTLEAFKTRGIQVSPSPPDLYSIEDKGHRYYIRFEEASTANVESILYNEASNSFHRLVDQVTATALHRVEDIDRNPEQKINEIVHCWIESFGGAPKTVKIEEVSRKFEGRALIRVRATILHDSYERLVEVSCPPDEHTFNDGQAALRTLAPVITDVAEIGINLQRISDAATLDEGIAEFSRFYLERREQEVHFAREDERKRRKLYDEFTPRFEATVVALEGTVRREISARAQFDINDGADYECVVTAIPSSGEITKSPVLDFCTKTGRKVPRTCLALCQISGAAVLRHLLVESEQSGRLVLPEFIEVCSLTGKRAARDELAVSDLSSRRVIAGLLRTSEISGKRAEPEFFARCSFSGAEALKSELATSSLSGRLYRIDQEATSDYSRKKGHKSEFMRCFVTRQLIGLAEAEKCQETGELVRPGVLVKCEVTGEHVLPSLCGRCSVTNKVALKRVLVSSSISQAVVRRDVAVKSSSGKFCLPAECETCAWIGQKYHPDDLGKCMLTGLSVHSQFLTKQNSRLRPLFELVNDVSRLPDGKEYPVIESALARRMNGTKSKIVSGAISPTKNALAVCAEVKHLFGLKTTYIGFVFSPLSREVVGKVAQGRRSKHGWVETG